MDMESVLPELDSPQLARYRLSERRAILVHKYFLGLEMHYDPGLDCAIQSWETRFACVWRRERQMADCQAQLQAIEQHWELLRGASSAPVSWEQAAHDWVTQYAGEWRKLHEAELTKTM